MNRPVLLGVLVGLATGGAAAFAIVRRDERASGDAGTSAALERALVFEPPAGVWSIEQPHRKRQRTIVTDPLDHDLVFCWFEEDETQRVKAFQREFLTKRLFPGDFDLFRRNYRPTGPASETVVEGRAAISVSWSRGGCSDCAVRVVTVDRETRSLVRIEDRTWDGKRIHEARLLAAGVDPSKLADAPSAEVELARKVAREQACKSTNPVWTHRTVSWPSFVEKSPLPVYEPARLPRGFARLEYAYDGGPKFWDPERPIDVVTVVYGDGVARIVVHVARTADLVQLENLAARQPRMPGPDTCPTNLADTPEDLVDVDSIVVSRRRDECRTILRRDFDAVSVALVAFNECPPKVYEEVVKSLALAKGSRATPEPRREKK